MPSYRSALLHLSAGAAAGAALFAVGTATVAAAPAPATDAQGYVDSTARCAAPSIAVAFGRTSTSRIAICKSPDGTYQYRGVRVRDGAKLIIDADSSGGGVYTAENDSITYTVSEDDLIVSAGTTVIREEQMLEFNGPSSPASSAPTSATPTTPLPPPLPAEVGGSGS